MPRRIAVLTALFLLGIPGVASAQWSPPRTVSRPHQFIGPLFVAPGPFAAFDWQNGTVANRGLGASAVGPSGEVVAPAGLAGIGRYASTRALALSQQEVSSVPPQQFLISYSFGSVDGFGGAPIPLRTAATINEPQLSVAPNGAALAAWIEIHGERDIVRVAYRPAGGRFGRPSTLLGRGQATVVAAAIGADNDLTVVAQRNGKVVARVRPRGGHWGAVQTLATARGGTQWQLATAIDGTGHVQVVWRRDQLGRSGFPAVRSIEAASASRQRAFGSAQTLSGDGAAGAPVLLNSPEGWTVAYPQTPATDANSAVARVQVRRTGQRFGAPVDASPPTAGLHGVSIAADSASGRLLAGWIAPATASRGYAAVRPFGGAFGTPEAVTPDEAVQEIGFMAAATGGSFTAAWVARPGDGNAVVREADGPAS
jgi:hypothetical protein